MILLFNLYYNISIICIFLNLLLELLDYYGIGEMPDAWQQMKELQENLDSINSEKLKMMINNFIDACVNYPANAIIFTILISFTPILHILIIISTAASILERFK